MKPHFAQKTVWEVVNDKRSKGYGCTPKKALADLNRKQIKDKRLSKLSSDLHVAAHRNGVLTADVARLTKELYQTSAECKFMAARLAEKKPVGLNDSSAEGWLMMAMAYTGRQDPQGAVDKMIEIGCPPGDGIEQAIKTVREYVVRWGRGLKLLPTHIRDRSDPT